MIVIRTLGQAKRPFISAFSISFQATRTPTMMSIADDKNWQLKMKISVQKIIIDDRKVCDCHCKQTCPNTVNTLKISKGGYIFHQYLGM